MTATSQSDPTSAHLTLLLRSSAHTILLYALPTTPLAALKSDLLHVLSARGIKTIGTSEVPDGATDWPVEDMDAEEALAAASRSVDLGVMIDRRDWRKGFRLVGRDGSDGGDRDDDEDDDEDGLPGEDGAAGTASRRGRGRGRGRAGGSGNHSNSQSNAQNHTVASVGLKGGDVVAFRFHGRGGKAKGKGKSKRSDGDDIDMLGASEEGEEADGAWDVVWPTYDDEEE